VPSRFNSLTPLPLRLADGRRARESVPWCRTSWWRWLTSPPPTGRPLCNEFNFSRHILSPRGSGGWCLTGRIDRDYYARFASLESLPDCPARFPVPLRAVSELCNEVHFFQTHLLAQGGAAGERGFDELRKIEADRVCRTGKPNRSPGPISTRFWEKTLGAGSSGPMGSTSLVCGTGRPAGIQAAKVPPQAGNEIGTGCSWAR
jgi:hypothetical protein